jgi:hypothetical protein
MRPLDCTCNASTSCSSKSQLVCFSSDPYSLPLKLTTLRIFTQKEVELARARIGPTDSKPLTGLFKWKDIKRWHTTWHVYLCKSLSNGYFCSSANEKRKVPLYFTFAAQFGQSGGSSASSAPPKLLILFLNKYSDFLGQILQRYWQETRLLRC